MDTKQAHDLASSHGFPLGLDFHALRMDQVQGILDAAKLTKYRKPRNANGSIARYFYARLNRA